MKSVAAVSFLAAIAFAFAGCAGRPHGVLIPVETPAPPGASLVEMLVATTRSVDGAGPGEMFTGERGIGLAFADVAVSIPPDSVRQIGEVQWPQFPPGDPRTDFVTRRADILPKDEAIRRFDARIARTPKRQALLFVHGYNTRFEEAVYRFAQIVHDSGTDALPVLFTWPSRGRLLAYGYDHESASYSRDALEAVLQSLAKDRSVGEISILAHSMGNLVAMEALRQMAIRDKKISPKIRNVMLAAPDIDFDVFRRETAEIGKHNASFVLFVSRDDEALRASKRVWGNKPRVGAIDPQQEPYQHVLEARRILTIDLTDVKSDDFVNHTKFAEAPEVVRAIGRRLSEGQTLDDPNIGVGDKFGQVAVGAAGVVGSAAGAAVSAPFAVIDGRTRDNLSDRLEHLGAQAGETISSGADALGGR